MVVRPYAASVFGALCTAISLELFYIPHRFLDGGMVGLAVIIGRSMSVQPVYVLFLLNTVCICVGIRILGEQFIYRAATAFVTMGLVLSLVGPLDPLLPRAAAAVVGGAGVGFGVSLVVLAGGAVDGCEILGLICRRVSGFSIPWFSFLFNAVVFTFVALLYGFSASAYSILAQGTGLVVMSVLLRDR